MQRTHWLGFVAGAYALLASVCPPATARENDTAPHATDDDADLARATRLDAVLARALAANPEIEEARARARASLDATSAARGLPDTELKTELWNVPGNQPLAIGKSDSVLVGLRQSFPAWGARDAQTHVAEAAAQMAEETRRTREQDVATQVRKAYYDYVRAEREIAVHQEHAALASHIVDLTRAEYRAGRHTQPEVLETMVELTRLHTDVVGLEQERASARGMLNILMGRDADAPLGPPEALEPNAVARRAAALPSGPDTSRPEVTMAERAVAKGEAAVDLARRNATYPSVMVGADYWNNPQRDQVNAYGAMVTVNLPWLSTRRRDEVRQAEGELAADRSALAAVRHLAGFQALDARARADSAARAYRLTDADLIPKARQSYEATEAAFAAGQMDALAVISTLRAYLEVRLEHTRALVRWAQAVADLERALGTATAEVHHD